MWCEAAKQLWLNYAEHHTLYTYLELKANRLIGECGWRGRVGVGSVSLKASESGSRSARAVYSGAAGTPAFKGVSY